MRTSNPVSRLAIPLCAATLLLFLPVWAESQTGGGEEAVLNQVLSKAATVDRISADFVQERHTSMLLKPVVATGHLYYEKPDRLRWEQKQPTQSGFIVDGNRIKRWSGPDGRVDSVPLSREPAFAVFANQVFAWCKGDIEWLKKRYDLRVVSRTPIAFRLLPLDKREKQQIVHLLITFAEDETTVSSVEIMTRDKDTIQTSFRNVSINEPIPKGVFLSP